MTPRTVALESALRALVAVVDEELLVLDSPPLVAVAEQARAALAMPGEEVLPALPADPAGRALLERIAEARRDALEEAAVLVETRAKGIAHIAPQRRKRLAAAIRALTRTS